MSTNEVIANQHFIRPHLQYLCVATKVSVCFGVLNIRQLVL